MRRSIGRGCRRVLLALSSLVACLAGFSPASAEAPATKLVTAPLVSPGEAWTVYGADQTHTNGTASQSVTLDLKTLSNGLGAGHLSQEEYIQSVFEYVQDNVSNEFRFGLAKGAVGAAIDQSGTPFDQAELMVKLLRAGGVSASYQLGTISPSPEQFGRWSGLVKSLDEEAQTFSVDAKAACQFLADGGVPAIVNDASDCDLVSGDLVRVTLAHIWVSSGGALYDPAFKVHVLKAGADLPAIMGCGTTSQSTCGANLRDGALLNATSSSTGGMATLQNLNEGELAGRLGPYAVAIQAYAALAPQKTIADIVGGKEVDKNYVASVGLKYPYSLYVEWSGEIPDSYRTTLTVTFGELGPQMLYADEISGKRVRILLDHPPSGYIRLMTVEASIVTQVPCSSCIATNDMDLTISVGHPYAALSGQYADNILTNTVTARTDAITLVSAFGNSSGYTAQHASKLELENHQFLCFYISMPLCKNFEQHGLAARYVLQKSASDILVGRVSRSEIQNHGSIGVAFADAIFPTTGTYTPWEAGVSSYIQVLNIQSSVSIASHTGDPARRQAAFGALAQMQAMLEGSVLQQSNDSWESVSTAGIFALANQAHIRFMDVQPGGLIGVSGQLSNYASDRLSRLQAMSSAGYGLILPMNGKTGCFSFTGGSMCHNGGAEYGYASNAIALLLNATRKGGGDTPGEPAAEAIASVSRQANSGAKRDAGLSVTAGSLMVAPAADLVSGAGGFPLSLPFKRFHSSDAASTSTYYSLSVRDMIYTGLDADVFGRLGIGWVHNYNITARLGNDAYQMLNPQSAADASTSIATIQSLVDLGGDSTFQSRLASVFTAHWLSKQFIGSIVTVSRPPGAETFVRQANGAYRAAASSSTVTLSGTRRGPRIVGSNMMYYYNDINILYTDKGGEKLRFSWSTAQTVVEIAQPLFKLDSWDLPNGISLKLSYDLVEDADEGTGWAYILTKVENNIGRSLAFTMDRGAQGLGGHRLNEGWPILSVADEGGRKVLVEASSDLVITDPEGTKTIYRHSCDGCKGGYLRGIYLPVDNPKPWRAFSYDERGKLVSMIDALDHQTLYLNGFLANEPRRKSAVIDPLSAITRTWLDDRGGVTQILDPLSRKTRNTFDGLGRLIRTEQPEHNAQEWIYDVRGNVLRTCSIPKSRAEQDCDVAQGDIAVLTSYVEDQAVWPCVNAVICNRAKAETDARGFITDYKWDWNEDTNSGTGLLERVRRPADVDGVQPQTEYVYAAYPSTYGPNVKYLKSKIENISADKSVTTTYEYDNDNKLVPLSVTIDGANLNIVQIFGFDEFGNLKTIDGPRTDVNDVSSYDWDRNRRLTYAFKPAPSGDGQGARAAIRYHYNNLDGTLDQVAEGVATSATAEAFSAKLTTTYVYDALGNRIQATMPEGVAQYGYDANDRLICTAIRMNRDAYASLPVDADACWPVGAAGSFGDDRITKTIYDPAGQVTDIQRGLGTDRLQTWSHTNYTDNGQRRTLDDANGNRTTFTYDGFDRLIQQNFPVTTVGAEPESSTTDYEAYNYDANGNRVWFQKRDTRIFTYDYDALNRQIVKHYPGDVSKDVYVDYDLMGRMISARFESRLGPGVFSTYDKAGRRRAETTDGLTIASEYDAAGQRKRVTWPGGGYVEYDYDAAGALTTVREPGGVLPGDRIAGFTYDGMGRREGAVLVGGTVQATYQYNPAGQLDMLRYDGLSNGQPIWQDFTYNPASQVDSVTQHNPALIWTGHPSVTSNYTANGLNQDAAIAAQDGGGYDLNGNLKSDGTRQFQYDAENRLTSVSGASSLAITYDPLGRIQTTMAAGTKTRFLYDGDRLTAEYAENGVTLRRYVHGVGADDPLLWYEGGDPTERRWLLADRQGSIVAHVVLGGAATLYTYGPYGEAQSWDGSRFRYTGQIALPEAELYHYKARVYDPKMGRFLQTDPIGYRDDMNLYAYTSNDPMNRTDPSGENSYLVCRSAVVVGNHCFIVVTNEDGSVRKRFSYGPQSNDTSRPGKLVETSGDKESDTNKNDAAAWEKGKDVRLKVDLTKRGFKDDAIISAGEKVDKLLGTANNPGKTGYDFAPKKEDGKANSNSGAARVLEEASPGSSRLIAPSFGITPGVSSASRVGTAPAPAPDPCPRGDICTE